MFEWCSRSQDNVFFPVSEPRRPRRGKLISMLVDALATIPNESDASVVTAGRPTLDDSGPALEDSIPSVLEINDLRALERHGEGWNLLLEQTPGASYFQSYDWFADYWRHWGGARQMRVLLVLADDRLAGVVPLVVSREPTRVGRLRSLQYPLHSWGTFYGPIGPSPRFLLRAALRHVLSSRRDWDLLDLQGVDHQGSDHGATGAACNDLRLATRASPWLQSAQVNLAGGWDAYWAGRTTHFRTNIRRCERSLREAGNVSHIRYRPRGAAAGEDDPRWDLYDACESIAERSWQGRSTTGTTLSHESVREYLRAAHRSAAAFGGVDLNLLLLDGRPAAFAYNYHFRGSLYGLRAGFDGGVSSSGAGSVLMRMMIEESCARGDHWIDLGPGSLETKRFWWTRVATAWRYTHYSRRSPRAQLLRVLHAVKASAGFCPNAQA